MNGNQKIIDEYICLSKKNINYVKSDKLLPRPKDKIKEIIKNQLLFKGKVGDPKTKDLENGYCLLAHFIFISDDKLEKIKDVAELDITIMETQEDDIKMNEEERKIVNMIKKEKNELKEKINELKEKYGKYKINFK